MDENTKPHNELVNKIMEASMVSRRHALTARTQMPGAILLHCTDEEFRSYHTKPSKDYYSWYNVWARLTD